MSDQFSTLEEIVDAIRNGEVVIVVDAAFSVLFSWMGI